MKKYLKYIFISILLIISIYPNKISAESFSSEYEIKSYNIDMVVNEDNTFDITEEITANFYVSKHGIYRKIPLRNSITRNDGTKSNNRARVTNLWVSEQYAISKESGYEVIKIGSSSKVYTGIHSYTIKYKYDIGKDPLKNVDELYYNLIGDEWDTNISDITFKITMPKTFDKSLLGFSSGDTGSTNSSNVFYSVNENIITGSLKNQLYGGQALTVRLTLPEGYFVRTDSDGNIDIYSIVVIIICLVFVLIADKLWIKYGKDDEVIETVEFYPPEGYNSAEIGFLYEGSAENESIISLLIYLADKGYVKIEEIEEPGLFKKTKGFKITKIKEYDGNNEYEKIFFNGLFKQSEKYLDLSTAREIMKTAKMNGEKISMQKAMEMSMKKSEPKISVTSSDLYDKFFITLNEIKEKFNSKENKSKIFEMSSLEKIRYLIMMIIGIFILITTKPVLEYDGMGNLIVGTLFSGVGISVLIGSLFEIINIPKSGGVVVGVAFGIFPWIYTVLPSLMQKPIYLIMYIIGIISVIVIMLFIKIMPKRTPYGNEILGKIRGFKRFLETAEKPQLESLVAQNPEYFYNILPYTYALGVSDVWINQFETIAMEAPSWYDSTGIFDMHTFESFMTTTMSAASSSMSSSSDSGGGSSGGGSGGGGGGSW